MAAPLAPSSVWCLSEGHAGMETQLLGLAQALGLEPVVKRVRVRRPWDWLPGRLWPRPLAALRADADGLAPPWPDLVLSTGNVAAPLAVAIKDASGGRTRLVHVQNPKLPLDRFDLVIAPRHDRLVGPNVIETRLGLHRVTPAHIAAAAALWQPRFAAQHRPLVGVLLGGSNRRFRLDAAVGTALGRAVGAAVRAAGGAVLATASRRTDPAAYAAFAAALGPRPGFVWDGRGDNPYLALLGLADHLLVTADSVSMISEALITGRPVQVLDLPGRSRRLGRFVADLEAEGALRRFAGRLESWPAAAIDELPVVAEQVRRRLGWPAPDFG